MEGKKASTTVSENERYYVQQQAMHAWLVRELAFPEEHPGEHDRLVRVFPDPASAYQFADAANAMQRKLDRHTSVPWWIRAV